ncbi:lipopolysaccharide-binding protein-like [Discoglossus pictus]
MAGAHGLALALALFLCLRTTDAVNPGSVVRITQKGLDYACQEGLTILHQQLSQITLPDFLGSYRVSVFGSAQYNFSSLVISNVQLPTSKVILVPKVGLKLTSSLTLIQVDGQWKIKYAFISGNGNFNMKVKGLNISVDLQLGSDGQGRPTMNLSNCNIHISDIDVDFYGKNSWVLNLFRGSIEPKIKNALEQQICPKLTIAIDSKLQPLLKTLPVTAQIDRVAALDYSLMGPPEVTAQYMDISLKGEFFDLSQRTTPPFSAPNLTFTEDHSRMVYVGVSDYLFNTASFVYQSAGALVLNVTSDEILKNYSVKFDSSSFGLLIPQISQMYPKMPIKLTVSSYTTPLLGIKPGALTLSPTMDIQAYAILPNSSLAPLFLLNMTTNALAKVAINSSRIVGNVELSRVEITLKNSDVGPFSVAMLNTAVNSYLTYILLPQVNELLKKGYPLPLLEHIYLQDVMLQPYKNYILLGANIHYGK